jgi:hypothetical protein
MYRIGLTVALILVGLTAESRASFFNGNQLYEMCSRTTGTSIGMCLAYIDGVVDEFGWARRQTGLADCLPSVVTGRQLRDLVVQWLTSHPADRADEAESLVQGAIAEAWPECSR